MAVARRKGITLETTPQFLNVLFSEDVHAKRIYSLANATLGVISSASLAVNTIGQGLALARGRLAKALPADVKVLIVADRGFGDQKLYRFLTEELKFDYLIRFRGNIAVTSAEGETRPAADRVGGGGRPRPLRNAFVTCDGYQIGTVVCVHAKDMKEPWCLAASTTTDTAKQLMTTYAKRWGIESGFRDTKDLRFGMGMAWIRVSTPQRRDRLWLLNAFAVALLTLLGAAGEALGYDRLLKSNTSKQRTHSLFRQGAMLYELIPMMPEPRLRPLVERFGAMLLEIPAFAGLYGAI